jgi:hypothetical protein
MGIEVIANGLQQSPFVFGELIRSQETAKSTARPWADSRPPRLRQLLNVPALGVLDHRT